MEDITINNYYTFAGIRDNQKVKFPMPKGFCITYKEHHSDYTYWMDAPGVNNNVIFERWGFDAYKMAQAVYKRGNIINNEWPGASHPADRWELICHLFNTIKKRINEKPKIEEETKKESVMAKKSIKGKTRNTWTRDNYHCISGELQVGDYVEFELKGETLEYEVSADGMEHPYFLINLNNDNNDKIFEFLGLDANDFTDNILDYSTYAAEGDFPECEDLIDLGELIEALFREVEDTPRYKPAKKKASRAENDDEESSSININKSKNEKGINVPRITPTIGNGEKITGHRTSSETCKITISSGHQCYRGISR